MLSESLRVAFRADDAVGTILVGSALTLVTWLLLAGWAVALAVSYPLAAVLTVVVALPSLVVRGYLLSVVEASIGDAESVPSFVRWGSLARTGWQSALISAVYALPGAVLCGLALGGIAATVASPSGYEEATRALAAVLVFISGFGLLGFGLVYLYVRPAARAVFAATGSLRAALDVRRALRLASSADYLTGWLIAMGLLVIGPSLLFPAAFVIAIVGVFSPSLAVVMTLATFLVGIGLLFVFRVSAAWATGRGAVDGLGRLPTVTLP
ncbi:MAG: DUF4013 domain-containing protein, partial [Halohasta sp.]